MRTMFFKTLLLSVASLCLMSVKVNAQFDLIHIGDGATGSITTNGPGDYTFIGGGNDIWSAVDNFDYAKFDATGDFDVRVRVESVEPVARWTKAGLMARETIANNSRMAFNRVTPPDVPTPSGGNGANDTRYAYRTGTTAGTQGEHEDGSGAPSYPNGWLRLRRTGAVFDAFRSTDGANWSLQGSQDTTLWEGGALPATVMLGLAVSRHSGPDPLATVEFREYGDANTAVATITRQPANRTVTEGLSATFDFGGVGGFDAPFYTVQWYRGGVLIPGATGPTYTVSNATLADNGATFHVVYGNNLTMSSATSSTATLTVNPDPTPPTLVSANSAPGVPTAFTLVFSEAVNETDAETLSNYSINNGVTINSATLQPDGRSVLFDVSPLNTPGVKVLTVNNVRDLFNNAIVANSQITIIYAEGRIRYHQWTAIGGTAVSDLLNNPEFPDRPDRIEFPTQFENPEGGGNHGNDHGNQFLGLVTAPVTGNYRFFIAADDNAVLYLSTDESPANKVQIAREPEWANFREYTGPSYQDPGTATQRAKRVTCVDQGGGLIFCENVSALIPLTAGNRYYIEFIYKEGGGGDYGSVAWQLPGGPVPANGSAPIQGSFLSPYNVSPSIGNGLPANQTVNVGQTATFTITAAGSPNLDVYWYRDGALVANGFRLFSYTTPINTAGDNGATFQAVASNSVGTASSRIATLTVNSDSTPPTLISASSFNGKHIGVCFSENMDSATATTPGNYTVNGVSPTNVVLRSDSKSVILDMDTPATSPFTVVVNNVNDFAGNPIAANSTVNGMIWATAQDVTAGGVPTRPNPPGSTNFTCAVGDVDVIAGGADIWTGTDEFHFIHNQRTGDFDVKVKVQRLDPSNRWAKAGLMARISLDPSSPTIQAYTTPPSAAVAELETGLRPTPGAETGGWELFRPSLPRPNVWVRLRRTGDTFRSYYGQDGANWNLLGERVLPGVPGTLFVGIATTSHNISQNTTAEYRSYMDFTYPNCSVGFAQNPQSQTVSSNSPVQFSAVLNANLPDSELVFQWQRSSDGGMTFNNIAGATGTSYLIPFATSDLDGNQFRLTIAAPGCSATSTAATLTLTNDTVRPRVKIVLGPVFGTNVAVLFTEPMGDSTPDSFAYSLTDTAMNPVTIADAQFEGANTPNTNRTRVNLTLLPDQPLTLGQQYILTVTAIDLSDPPDDGIGPYSGVVDMAGNPIDPNPTTVTFTAQNINFNPDTLPTLPTTRRLPLGSLTQRGFDGRSVDIVPAIPNANGVAEAMLAGVYTDINGNTLSNEAPVICWFEPNVVNYNNEAGGVGAVSGDVQFPGANPATDNIAIEIIGYAELTAGLHRWAVNSDDGFRVSPALFVTDPDNAITLGEFNGGRGAATTEFSFIVPEDGLYPFRLMWEEGQGGMNLEFWSRNLVTDAIVLLNGAGGVPVFRVPLSVSPAADLSVVRDASHVVVSWNGSSIGCLQAANSISGPWVAVRGAEVRNGNTKYIRIPIGQAMQFYRHVRP